MSASICPGESQGLRTLMPTFLNNYSVETVADGGHCMMREKLHSLMTQSGGPFLSDAPKIEGVTAAHCSFVRAGF